VNNFDFNYKLIFYY